LIVRGEKHRENLASMKAPFLLLVTILVLEYSPLVRAQDATSSTAPVASAAELEAKFQQTMTAATFTGQWTPIKDGALGEAKPEKYTIVSVAKTGGDNWLINSKMRYQGQEIVAPIPVQVKWAGDTAVIIVNQLSIPGGGTYSARVLIHDGTYAGTWSGGTHGGLLNGLITKTAETKP
jgi:hypothetical protein